MTLTRSFLIALSIGCAISACNTTKTDGRTEQSGATSESTPQKLPAPPGGAPSDGTPSGGAPGVAVASQSVGTLAWTKAAAKDMAPDFGWTDGAGQSRSLAEYRGKVVLLNFWGTWCPPCRRELPSLVKIREELSRDEFEIIGINVGEQERNGLTVEQHVAAFASTNQLRWPLVIANEEIVNAYGGIEAVPTTFVIDKTGRIAEKIVGSRDEAGFRNAIKAAL